MSETPPTEEAVDTAVAASAHRRRLARSTAVFAAATGLSRILGLVREIVARRYFGVEGAGINAFTAAFQVPNLVRSLVADQALTAAFVPIFSELLEKGERARAWRVASTLFWLLLLVLGALTALFMLAAPLVMGLFGFEGEQQDLAVTLSQILFPIVTLLGVSGVIVGILNSYEEFTIPALTPVAWNLVIIAGLVIGVPQTDSTTTALYVYAGAILVGTVVQVLLPVPWLYGLDGRLRLALDWRDPMVKRVLVLMLPVTLGLGLINFNQVIGTVFASRLIDPTLSPAAIDAAFRVYMLPQGIFSVAVATVLFPSLSRLSTREDWAGFRAAVSLGLRQIAFMLVPASALCAVLADPIVRLLYQRGEFGPDQTTVVAAALAAFSLGLTFNGFMLMLNRAFFSLQQPWLPTLVAVGNLVLNTILYFAFYRVGTWGIPLAISLANVTASAALFVLLRRRLGRMDFGAILSTLVRVTVASAVMAAAAYGVWRGLDELLGRGVLMQTISLLTALLAAAVVYVLAARALGVRELEALLALRRRRGAQ